MVTECEEKLPSCHLSQLETRLQRGTEYVYNAYGT